MDVPGMGPDDYVGGRSVEFPAVAHDVIEEHVVHPIRFARSLDNDTRRAGLGSGQADVPEDDAPDAPRLLHLHVLVDGWPQRDEVGLPLALDPEVLEEGIADGHELAR